MYEQPSWSGERANVVVQPIPFECTPVQVRVPSEQSPASRNVFRGQKAGPHSAKETESLKAPPLSSNWPPQVQLPLKPQTNSKQSSMSAEKPKSTKTPTAEPESQASVLRTLTTAYFCSASKELIINSSSFSFDDLPLHDLHCSFLLCFARNL